MRKRDDGMTLTLKSDSASSEQSQRKAVDGWMVLQNRSGRQEKEGFCKNAMGSTHPTSSSKGWKVICWRCHTDLGAGWRLD